MAARRYTLGKRAEGMAETRRKVLAAARELFLEANFHEVSIEEVARRAGVGRTTIFQQFESKAGLLRALEQDVSERAGVEALLRELDREDGREALRVAFEVGCRVWAAEHAMFRKLIALAALDPEMGKVMAEKDARRHELAASIVAKLARQGHLRPACTRVRASAMLGLLSGFPAFDALYQAKRSPSAVAAVLLELAGAFAVLQPA